MFTTEMIDLMTNTQINCNDFYYYITNLTFSSNNSND